VVGDEYRLAPPGNVLYASSLDPPIPVVEKLEDGCNLRPKSGIETEGILAPASSRGWSRTRTGERLGMGYDRDGDVATPNALQSDASELVLVWGNEQLDSTTSRFAVSSS